MAGPGPWHSKGKSRVVGSLMLFGALIAAMFVIAGVSEVVSAPQKDLHSGVIDSGGHQVVTTRVGSGPFQETRVPFVEVKLDNGTRHRVESTPLYNLWKAAPGDLRVDVQLDANGSPKRIRYHGKWYGAGPPIWFWIGFSIVFLAAGALLFRAGFKRMRWRPPVEQATTPV
jgi:hypothetical protein